MPRLSRLSVPLDTVLFDPLQMQPRAALSLGMSGWAHWLRDHWTAFPWLIRDEHLGVVIAAFDVDACDRFGFFDADTFFLDVSVKLRSDGRLLYLDAVGSLPDGREVLRGRGTLRPVHIGDGLSLGALPGEVGDAVRARFKDDEVVERTDAGYARQLPPLLRAVTGEPVASAEQAFTVHRAMCEVADQWSAVAVPDLGAAVREQLCVESGGELAATLSQRMTKLHIEYRSAAFFMDRLTVRTTAHQHADGWAFVHRYVRTDGGDELAVMVEMFGGEPR